MIAWAAARTRALGAGHQPVDDAAEFGGVERLADHAGRGEENLGRLAAGGLAGDSGGVSLVASRPFLPVKALALPELTTSARACPDLRCARTIRPAPTDISSACETRGHAGSVLEQGEQHVGAPA